MQCEVCLDLVSRGELREAKQARKNRRCDEHEHTELSTDRGGSAACTQSLGSAGAQSSGSAFGAAAGEGAGDHAGVDVGNGAQGDNFQPPLEGHAWAVAGFPWAAAGGFVTGVMAERVAPEPDNVILTDRSCAWLERMLAGPICGQLLLHQYYSSS